MYKLFNKILLSLKNYMNINDKHKMFLFCLFMFVTSLAYFKYNLDISFLWLKEYRSLQVILFFIILLYIRSSIPRHKIIDFINIYWRGILVYNTAIFIILFILIK